MTRFTRTTTQLLTTSNFIGPWYHAALLFSGLGSIVLLFVLLFSQQIREDLVRAAYRRSICWFSDVSINHLRSAYCQNKSLPSNVRFLYEQNSLRNQFELAFINTTEIVLQLYLFPGRLKFACFVVKSALIMSVFLLTKSTKACLHL